jgi:hypothetical protein
MTTPTAPIVAMRTDGANIDQVEVACPYCGGRHAHRWFGEPDGYRQPSCGALATYHISIDTRARIEAMRTDFAAPDGVVGLVPLAVSFAFEMDGPDADVVGIVLGTTLGRFAVWLPTGVGRWFGRPPRRYRRETRPAARRLPRARREPRLLIVTFNTSRFPRSAAGLPHTICVTDR